MDTCGACISLDTLLSCLPAATCINTPEKQKFYHSHSLLYPGYFTCLYGASTVSNKAALHDSADVINSLDHRSEANFQPPLPFPLSVERTLTARNYRR